jgi:hypothetical protein
MIATRPKSRAQTAFLEMPFPAPRTGCRGKNGHAGRAAYFFDNYAILHPTETNRPGPPVDDKHSWLMQREERGAASRLTT